MPAEQSAGVSIEAILERARLNVSISTARKAQYGIVDDLNPVGINDGKGTTYRIWIIQMPEIDMAVALFEDSLPGSRSFWRIGPIPGKPLAERTEAEMDDFCVRAIKIKKQGRRIIDDDLDWHLQTALLDAQNGVQVLPH